MDVTCPEYQDAPVSSVDVDYFRRKAAAEREMAARSDRKDVAAGCLARAQQYQAMVDRFAVKPANY